MHLCTIESMAASGAAFASFLSSFPLDRVLALIGIILGLVGIAVSIFAWLSANRFSDNLRHSIKELDRATAESNAAVRNISATTEKISKATEKISLSEQELVKAIPTKSEGTFPDYFDRLTELVRSCKHNLEIMAVVPDTGSFSYHKKWAELHAAILTKVAQMADNPYFKKTLLYSSESARRENYIQQYEEFYLRESDSPEIQLTKQAEWSAYKRGISGILENLRERALGRLHKKYARHLRENIRTFLDELSLQDLIDLRIEEDDFNITSTFGVFTKTESQWILPLFCWICDGEAIFSIKVEDRRGHYLGEGFYTRDGDIIKALRNAYRQYSPYKPGI